MCVDDLAYAKAIDKDHFKRDTNTLIVNYRVLLKVSRSQLMENILTVWRWKMMGWHWQYTQQTLMFISHSSHTRYLFWLSASVFVSTPLDKFDCVFQIEPPYCHTIINIHIHTLTRYFNILLKNLYFQFLLANVFSTRRSSKVQWNVVLVPASLVPMKWNRKWHRTSIEICMKSHRVTLRQK